MIQNNKPVSDMNDAEVQFELVKQYTKHVLEETIELKIPHSSDGKPVLTPRDLLRLYRAVDTTQ